MNLKYSTSYPHGQENRQDNKSIKSSSRQWVESNHRLTRRRRHLSSSDAFWYYVLSAECALPTEPHGENVTPTCLRHPAVLPRRSIGVV